MELRCESQILHGRVWDGTGTLEVACRSHWCGKRPGVLVRHRFDLSSGEILSTDLYKDPMKLKKEEGNASRERVPVRTA